METKTRGCKFDEDFIFTESQSISQKLLINHKRKENNFLVEKPDAHHLGQVITDNITNNDTNPTSNPSGWMHQGRHNITSGVFLPKIHHPDLITRKHQTNPDWRTFYKMPCLHSSKMSMS